MPVDRLAIDIRAGGERHAVILAGELDVASADLFESTLAKLCVSGAKEVVVDLSGVEFIDSSGINALLRSRMRCEEHDCGFELTPAQPTVQRVFEAARMFGKLPFRRGAHDVSREASG